MSDSNHLYRTRFELTVDITDSDSKENAMSIEGSLNAAVTQIVARYPHADVTLHVSRHHDEWFRHDNPNRL